MPTLIAQAKLRQATRLTVVDKKISAVLTSAITITCIGEKVKRTIIDLDCISTISLTTEKLLTTGFSNFTQPGYFQRGQRYQITDLGTADYNLIADTTGVTYQVGSFFTAANSGEKIPAVTGRAMLTSNLMTSTLTCKFPTYIRIDLEALGMDSYEGQDCIMQLDEGVVIQGIYPGSEFTPNPPEASFMTFRIPKYFRSQLFSSVSSSTLVLRIKQSLATNFNTLASVTAFAQRNPGKLAALVFSLGSISALVGNIKGIPAISVTGFSTVNTIVGFLKTMQANVSSAFATNLTAFRRFRDTASSLSMLFDQTYTSIESRIRFVQSSINVISDSSVIGNVRVRASAAITSAFASLVATPIKLHSANASLIVESSVNTTAQRPATYILNAGTGTVTFNYNGATNILVEWGDGTTSTLNSASGNSSISKSYSAPAISRTISITGTVTTIKGISSFYSPPSGQVLIAMPTFGDLEPITLDAFTTGIPFTQLPRRLPSSVTTLKMGAGIYTSTEYELWNTVNVTNMTECFSTSGNVLGDITSWNTSNVTNMSSMFFSSGFNQNINGWNVGNVTDMSNMFAYNTPFNQSLNSWNVSNVTNMSGMFSDNNGFNSDIYSWNTANVTNMSSMFNGCDFFNNNISSWNTANVTNMSSMFAGCTDFNQPIGSWNVSNVTNMQNMFSAAEAFNQPLNSWNVGNVTNMSGMFQQTVAFNQPLNSWNVSNVTNASSMFNQATNFQGNLANWQLTKATNISFMFVGENIAGQGYNQPIASWTLGKVTDASSMFENNLMFNQPLDGWGNWMDPAGSCTVKSMFKNTGAFNQSLNGWTTTRMTICEGMFSSALAFNGNCSGWNTSNVTNMREMFFNTGAFNNNISSWNTSNVNTMMQMFEAAIAFNQPIGSWNVSNVTTMLNMFAGATVFNQDLSAWNLYKAPTTGVGPQMSSFWHSSYSYGSTVGISQENYDRTIIGWANKAKAAEIALPGFAGKVVGTPRQVGFGRPTARTGSATTYGSGVYTTGAAAQTYLSGNPIFVAEGAQWTFTAG